MSNVLELKNKKTGEVQVTCLFGMQAIIDFCTSKGIEFSDFQAVMSDKKNIVAMISNVKKIIYHAAENYATYNDLPFTLSEKKCNIILDECGIMDTDVMSSLSKAIFSGFENAPEEDKKKVTE